MSALDEIRSRFQNDRFATEVTGIVIDLAEPGKAVCSLTLTERHMNENHVPMGGAVFTLADFACAVAANGYSERATVTVSQNVSITYLAPAKGTRLIAEAWCLRSGKTTALYAVDVRDELDTYVAHAAVNGYVISHNKS
ncbi:MAG: PaaI family thioesterase [Lachnospiraceae bacterium]|jgi:acyl-CoA thioesterase|nr:PaaI family thioesterase [Lachnospiraceae bacterium]